MKKVYLDNAATTALRPEVIDVITSVLTDVYGNPSSVHSFGRTARVILETSRKTIARLLNADAREIIFTSGGTEGNNTLLRGAVKNLKLQRIITTRIEHHAVLHCVEALQKELNIGVSYVRLLPTGLIDYNDLEELLEENIPTLVSLMHVNNETGTLLDLDRVGLLCKKHNAYFHSDTVQSVGKIQFDLSKLPVDFITASAHKFYGPKGAGFIFVRKNTGISPLLFGGEQEKGLRAGTEALHQIAGMAKALEHSYTNLDSEKQHIIKLRDYLLNQLDIHFTGYKINGTNSINLNVDDIFYNILNVQLPMPEDKTAMILFNLDMKGIAVSRGSACQSGSIKPSHVLKEILPDNEINKPSLRISFSHNNSTEDIDILINALKTV